MCWRKLQCEGFKENLQDITESWLLLHIFKGFHWTFILLCRESRKFNHIIELSLDEDARDEEDKDDMENEKDEEDEEEEDDMKNKEDEENEDEDKDEYKDHEG